MLTRRHIRLKVMQSLYSYFSNPNEINDIFPKADDWLKMLKQANIEDKTILGIIIFNPISAPTEVANIGPKNQDRGKLK